MKTRLLTVLVVAAAALIVTLACVHQTPTKIFFTTDFAVSLSVARNALEGEMPLLGPTSHIGGRHFGPWYYYALVGALQLSDGEISTTVLWLSAFNLLGFALVVATVRLLLPPAYRVAGILGTLLCGAGTHYLFVLRMPWHAHFYLIPIAALYFTLLLALRRHPLGVSYFALVSSLAIQTHYMCLPLVALFAGIVYLERGMFFQGQFRPVSHPVKAPVVCWLLWGLALLSWLPLVVYEGLYGGALIGFFKAARGAHGEHAGFRESLEALFQYWCVFGLPTGPAHRVISHELFPVVRWVFFLCLVVLGGRLVVAVDRASRFFILAGMLGSVVFLLLIARVAAPIPDYFFHSLLPLPAIAMGSLFGIALCSSGAQYGLRLWALAVGGIWILGSVANYQRYSERPYARWHTAQHSMEMARLIDRDREEQGTLDAPVIILAKGETRLSLAGYYYMLSGRHYSQLPEAGRYLELPSMDRAPIREAIRAHPTSYLTVCPRPPPHHRQAMWQKVKARWKLETELSTTGYGALRNCKVYRLHRRAEKKDGSPRRSTQKG